MNKTLWAIAIILLVFVAGLVFGVPEFKAYRVSVFEFDKKQKDLAVQQSYSQALHDATQDLSLHQADIALAQEALPGQSDNAALEAFFASQAKANNVVLVSAVSQPSQSTSGAMKNITYQIKSAGRYNDLKKFLQALEVSSRLFEVENLSLQNVGKNYNLDILVTAHFLVVP